MAVKAGDLELELIDELAARVRQRLPGEPERAYAEFVRQYFHWVPAADLSGRSPLDLCGALVAHWRTAQRRPRPRDPEVRVYNPEVERDGWSSPFTVVEIVSDDMPFLVDSVTMELSRQGYAIELVIHPVMRVVRGQAGELIEVLPPGASASGMRVESVIHAEVARRGGSRPSGCPARRGRARSRGGARRRRGLALDARRRRRARVGAGHRAVGLLAPRGVRGPGLPRVAAGRQLRFSGLPRVRRRR